MMPTGTRNLLMELLMGQVQAEQRGAEVEERTNMLPLVRYNDGTTGLGVPGAVYGPAQSAYNMLTTDRLNRALMGDDQAMQQSTRDSFDAASLAAVGGLAAPRPRGSIGMGGRPSPELDMSEAARMARAREMGFDTDTVWYHGTDRSFSEFDPSFSDDIGIYFTTDRNTAANYAGPDGGIIEALLNPGKKLTVRAESDGAGGGKFFDENGVELPYSTNDDIAEYARRNGYDSIEWPYGNMTEADQTLALFDPRRIRDRNAIFDPSQSGSANILYSANPFTFMQPYDHEE